MDLQDLYQELIIDHGTKPRHHCKLVNASHKAEGYNPLCGDHIILYLKIEQDRIQQVSFEGKGCAIATASASLMTEMLFNKTIEEAKKLFILFQQSITTEQDFPPELDKLLALSGVKMFPSRIKCATLAWHTLMAALQAKIEQVCTE